MRKENKYTEFKNDYNAKISTVLNITNKYY